MSNFVKIGALWKAKEGSKAVLTGKLGNASLLIFKNTRKQEGSNQPDYNVCVANPYKKDNEDSTDEPYMPDGDSSKSKSDEGDLPF